MPISKTKRFINVILAVAGFLFINHFSEQAFDQFDKASTAVENIRSR